MKKLKKRKKNKKIDWLYIGIIAFDAAIIFGILMFYKILMMDVGG